MNSLASPIASPSLVAVADRAPVACKVCHGPSPLFGVVDFHKSCMESRGMRASPSGCPVYYRRCQGCGFVFTDAFDGWAPEEFKRRIYNEEYILVDPDFAELRPAANARMVGESFRAWLDSIRILDYGGGTGVLAERLRGEGFEAETYDPFSSFNAMPSGRFDLITCFEVMEHVPQPRDTVKAMAGLLKEDGAILFSTLVQPEEFDREGLRWWYAAPRNGHISLYSTAALGTLFGQFGMRVVSFSAAMHMAYGRRPVFADELRLPE